MAIQLLHWCFTRRGETEAQREEREFAAQLQDDSDFLNEEANQIFHNMKLQAEKGKTAILHHYKIGDEAMTDLFKHFDRNTICLQLNLAHNIISDEGAALCAHSLRKNSTLLELNLSYNKIGDEGIARIGDSLRKNTCLLELHICENEFQDEGAVHVADALQTNVTLTSLCIGDSRVGDITATSLGRALERNGSLTRLDLFNCTIGDQGAAALAEGLIHRIEEDDEHIEDLNLGMNRIGDEGGSRLMKYVGKTQKLKVFQLYKNRITDTSLDVFIKEMEKNTCITQANLGGNKVTKPAIKQMYKVLEEYRNREKNPCKLTYINTYQCTNWGELDPEAQEDYDKWLAAQKAAAEAEKMGKKIEVDVPCDACKKKMTKMAKVPWPEWICNGCEKNYTQKDVCYACETVDACDFGYCAACFDKTSTILRQQKVQEQLAAQGSIDVDVLCTVCTIKLCLLDPGPWPLWICNGCEKGDLTKEDPLYGCPTCNECDYGLCKMCFMKEETKLRLMKLHDGGEKEDEKKEEDPQTLWMGCAAKDCGALMYRQKPGEDQWKCEVCEKDKEPAEPFWHCEKKCMKMCTECVGALREHEMERQVLCPKCLNPQHRVDSRAYKGWGCDGCGASPLQPSDACYACDTAEECDLMYCGKCFAFAGEQTDATELRGPVACQKCEEPANYKEPDQNPWQPLWSCSNCERTFNTEKDGLWTCLTPGPCDWGLCRSCMQQAACTLASGKTPAQTPRETPEGPPEQGEAEDKEEPKQDI